jgi:hypothetical protein
MSDPSSSSERPRPPASPPPPESPPAPSGTPVAPGAPRDGDAGTGDFGSFGGPGDDGELRDFPRGRGRRWATAVVGLVAIAALVLSAVMVRRAPSDDGGGASPSPSTTQPEPATQAEIEAAVAEISEFVAEQRGVEFLEPVDVELEGEGAFQDRLLADFDEDVDDLRRSEVVLQALGLVEPEVDVVESMRSLLGGGVVGFYDTESKELVVRGAALTPYVRTTIAHELVHALDDQHHDLERADRYDDADDEIGFGFSSIVEGNARRVENAYEDSLSAEERAAATAEEMSIGAGGEFDVVPPVLIETITAPYVLGERLVDSLADGGGEAAVDAAFADPPTTSEQVLDPARYAEREPAADVPHPQVDGEVIDEGLLGQLLVLLVLAEGISLDDARTAASGWGGDWAVVWRDGDRSCVTVTLVGDDAGETDELLAAFEDWAAADDVTYEATVTAAAGGEPFTVESCAV